jgi:hypothetical protein
MAGTESHLYSARAQEVLHLVKAPGKRAPVDPIAALEQRFIYRVHEYLADGRNIDAEFTLPGLRGWMLCQHWPEPAASTKLECLAVLSWTAICQVETEPDREREVRRELARQLDFLEGSSTDRPASLDALLSTKSRIGAYASLQQASEPGSARREDFGLPRFNAAEKLR